MFPNKQQMTGGDKVSKNVNHKLKTAILVNGSNQLDVAQYIGISSTAFNRKLNGFQQFKENEIEMICKFLNVPILDIFFYQGVTNQITEAN